MYPDLLRMFSKLFLRASLRISKAKCRCVSLSLSPVMNDRTLLHRASRLLIVRSDALLDDTADFGMCLRNRGRPLVLHLMIESFDVCNDILFNAVWYLCSSLVKGACNLVGVLMIGDVPIQISDFEHFGDGVCMSDFVNGDVAMSTVCFFDVGVVVCAVIVSSLHFFGVLA